MIFRGRSNGLHVWSQIEKKSFCLPLWQCTNRSYEHTRTHTHSCYCMNDSCSVSAPVPWKAAWWCHAGCFTVWKSSQRFEKPLHPRKKISWTWGSKMVWPFMRKTVVETYLVPPHCQIAEYDEWEKEGKGISNRQRGINYSHSCECVWKMQLYIETRNKL